MIFHSDISRLQSLPGGPWGTAASKKFCCIDLTPGDGDSERGDNERLIRKHITYVVRVYLIYLMQKHEYIFAVNTVEDAYVRTKAFDSDHPNNSRCLDSEVHQQ